MSVKRKISIRNAVQSALDNMGGDEVRDTPIFISWAVEADRKIGSYYAYKRKICVLDVTDCTAELPCDAVAVLGVLLGDHGCDCDLNFESIFRFFAFNRINVDATANFVVIDSGAGSNTGTTCSNIRWEIQNNNLIFSSKIELGKVTIQYLGYEVDECKFPLINENHVDAIAQYIEYKAAMRIRWKPVEYRINATAIHEMKREWNRKVALARGDDADPSESERAEIKDMINNPMSGVGIAMWKYNDYWFRGGF